MAVIERTAAPKLKLKGEPKWLSLSVRSEKVSVTKKAK